MYVKLDTTVKTQLPGGAEAPGRQTDGAIIIILIQRSSPLAILKTGNQYYPVLHLLRGLKPPGPKVPSSDPASSRLFLASD